MFFKAFAVCTSSFILIPAVQWLRCVCFFFPSLAASSGWSNEMDCNWISVFWITLTGQSLQDFEVKLVVKSVVPKSAQTGLHLDCYLSNLPQPFIKHMWQSPSNFLAILFACVCFWRPVFCTKIMRRNQMIYSVEFKKTVWKYLNITNQTFFIILLFNSIKSKAMNYCQKQGFQALIAATSRIKKLILVNFSELSGAEQRQVSNLYCREP